jgi:hypothetical protein
MDIEVLGSGCACCRAPYDDTNRSIARNGWQGLNVEYVQDIQRIMSVGVMARQVLVTNEKAVMLRHRGAMKIEQALRGISIWPSAIGPKETS